MELSILFGIVMGAWALIERILSHNKVSVSQVRELQREALEAAQRTRNPIDDVLADEGLDFVEWILRRSGRLTDDIFKDIEEKNEDNPPITLPDKPQAIGTNLNPYSDLNKYNKTISRNGRDIALPVGYGYVAQTGDTGVHTDAFWDEGQGMKMMLDNRGRTDANGKRAYFGYEATFNIHLQEGAHYSLAPHFDAKISGGAANIKGDILRDGVVIHSLNPHRIEGDYDNASIVWALKADETMDIRFRVYVEPEWATLTGDSYIRWRELPFTVEAVGYGGDSVTVLKKTT